MRVRTAAALGAWKLGGGGDLDHSGSSFCCTGCSAGSEVETVAWRMAAHAESGGRSLLNLHGRGPKRILRGGSR